MVSCCREEAGVLSWPHDQIPKSIICINIHLQYVSDAMKRKEARALGTGTVCFCFACNLDSGHVNDGYFVDVIKCLNSIMPACFLQTFRHCCISS